MSDRFQMKTLQIIWNLSLYYFKVISKLSLFNIVYWFSRSFSVLYIAFPHIFPRFSAPFLFGCR